MTNQPFFTTLKNRGLIQIEGADRFKFLQNLITNDISLLEKQTMIYSCLLSPQGKFLFDFFIFKGPSDTLFIECEGKDRADDLFKRLNLYRLRTNVKISCEQDHPVYAVLDTKDTYGNRDPRHPDIGQRYLKKPQGFDEKPFEAWDTRRLKFGIPDGRRDMRIGQSTMLECRIDRYNGVSFSKGCFPGQELTARMHYRGLTKKHLYAVTSEFPLPENGTDLHLNGKRVGEMRSSCGQYGLALLKDASIDAFNKGPIKTIDIA